MLIDYLSLFEIALLARIVELSQDAGQNPPAPVNVGDVDGDGIDDYEKVLAPNVKGIVSGSGGPLSKIFNLEIPAGVLVNPTGGNLIEIEYRKLGEVIWRAGVEYVVTGEVSFPIKLNAPGLASDRFEVRLVFKSRPGQPSGLLVKLNDDDDDGNDAADLGDLAPLPQGATDDELLQIANPFHSFAEGAVRLELEYPGQGRARIWKDSAKSQQYGAAAGMVRTWSASDDPETVAAEGIVLSSALGDVRLRWVYEPGGSSGSQSVVSDLTVVKVDIVAYRMGPGGAEVSEKDEEDPDNLLVVSNDDFEEGGNQPIYPFSDAENGVLDTSSDSDYFRIKLKMQPALSQGTLQLAMRHEGHAETYGPDTVLNIFSLGGEIKLQSWDFQVDLANPGSSPLAAATSQGGKELLAEGRDEFLPPGFGSPQKGLGDARLVWTYRLGDSAVGDEAAFHLIDVDFEEVAPNSGFDDNDDALASRPRNPGLMVPLGAGDAPGSNQVKVLVAPAGLFGKVRLRIDVAAIASIQSPSLGGPEQVIAVNGHAHGPALFFAELVDVQGQPVAEAGRMYIDVKQRLSVSPRVFRIKSVQDEEAPSGKDIGDIELLLNGETWGRQSNVFAAISLHSVPIEVDYDVNDTLGLRVLGGDVELVTCVQSVRLHDEAPINILYVSRFEPTTALGFNYPYFGKDYIVIPDYAVREVLAHEFGHALALSSSDHSKDATDLMTESVDLGGGQQIKKQIRRYDWLKVNP